MMTYGFGKKTARPVAAQPANPFQHEFSAGCQCGFCMAVREGVQNVKVLGVEGEDCRKMLENARAAMELVGMGVEVECLTDPLEAEAYGAGELPALVVNNRVVASGRVLRMPEVERILRKTGWAQ